MLFSARALGRTYVADTTDDSRFRYLGRARALQPEPARGPQLERPPRATRCGWARALVTVDGEEGLRLDEIPATTPRLSGRLDGRGCCPRRGATAEPQLLRRALGGNRRARSSCRWRRRSERHRCAWRRCAAAARTRARRTWPTRRAAHSPTPPTRARANRLAPDVQRCPIRRPSDLTSGQPRPRLGSARGHGEEPRPQAGRIERPRSSTR